MKRFIKRSIFLLVVLISYFLIQSISQNVSQNYKSKDIYLYYIKVNNLSFVLSNKQPLYLIPQGSSCIHISIGAKNARYASFYENNNLIGKTTFMNNDLEIDVKIKPSTESIKVVLENSKHKITEQIYFHYTNLNLEPNNTIIDFVYNDSLNIFLISSSTQIGISVFKNPFIYLESRADFSYYKLSIPINTYFRPGTIELVDDYLLVQLQTSKSYDTPIFNGYIYKIKNNHLSYVAEFKNINEKIILNAGKDSVVVNFDNKRLVIPYDFFHSNFVNLFNIEDKDFFDIKGIGNLSLYKKGDKYVIKLYYPLYHRYITPEVNLGNIVLNYYITDNTIYFYTLKFEKCSL